MTAEEIKSNVSMRDVLGKYGVSVNRNGMCCCPIHGEKHPSMKVYDDGYKCFACNSAGDVFNFVMAYENVDFKTAFMLLGGTYEKEQGRKARVTRNDKFRRIKEKKQRETTAIKEIRSLLEKSIFDCIWMINHFEPLSEEWSFGKDRLPYLDYLFEEIFVNENKGVNKGNVIRVCQRVRQKANSFGRLVH